MKNEKKLKLLEETITQQGYKVRYEKGNFTGGHCRLRDNNIVVVNKFLPVEGKVYTIARVLSKLTPCRYNPDVKKIIEDFGFNTSNQLPLIDDE